MNDKQDMGIVEFIISDIWWELMIWLFYKSFLFRHIDSFSLRESRYILAALVVVTSLIGILLEFRSHRDYLSIAMNSAAGLGIYTILTYFPIKPRLIFLVIVVSVALAVIYSADVLFHRIRNRKKFKRILFRRLCRAGKGSALILCIGLTVIMLAIGANTVFSSFLITPSVTPTNQADGIEQHIADNVDSLAKLKADMWKELSVDEKVDVLQVVANIEQTYLGLPHELNVGAANLREGVAGSYSDTDHEIYVSIDSLLNDSAVSCVDTIAHEAYHALEYRMVDAYVSASEEEKPLIMYYDASVYMNEFEDYTDSCKDLEQYASQKCESDARAYAKEATYDYVEKITDHLQISVYEFLGVPEEGT